ncbi:hypothetical protein VARIO8X_160251 [Burkholderiales bacterium 8X]|nr:hypothetical protein VARIO8X_160251 [Burkholderiales bacterium 8X]
MQRRQPDHAADFQGRPAGEHLPCAARRRRRAEPGVQLQRQQRGRHLHDPAAGAGRGNLPGAVRHGCGGGQHGARRIEHSGLGARSVPAGRPARSGGQRRGYPRELEPGAVASHRHGVARSAQLGAGIGNARDVSAGHDLRQRSKRQGQPVRSTDGRPAAPGRDAHDLPSQHAGALR